MGPKLFSAATLIFLLTSTAIGQTFQKRIDIEINGQNSIFQTSDGGYILPGETKNFGAGLDDFSLVKTDASGNIQWTKTYGGIDVDQLFFGRPTADGGYILVGTTHSFGAGLDDIYLVKTNSTGDTLWSRTYGGTANEGGKCVQQTTDGGYILVGTTGSFGSGQGDVYLIKTNSAGDTLWTRAYGSFGTETGNFVQQTSDGGYIITGTYGFSYSDAYLLKTDASGNISWSKRYGPASGNALEQGNSVIETRDNKFVMVGYTYDYGSGGPDMYAIKTNNLGDTLWTRAFGTTNGDNGFGVIEAADSGFVFCGLTSASVSDANVLKTDKNGNLQWSRAYGGNDGDGVYTVSTTSDGGYCLAGFTQSFPSGPNYYTYLIKTDASGMSGCHTFGAPTISSHTATVATTPTTTMSHTATVVKKPASIIGSGGTATTLCFASGIDQNNILDISISIFPNPVTNALTISFSDNILKGSLEIYDVLGKIILSEVIDNETKKEIHLADIASGIYFVKILAGKNMLANKFIVAHQ